MPRWCRGPAVPRPTNCGRSCAPITTGKNAAMTFWMLRNPWANEFYGCRSTSPTSLLVVHRGQMPALPNLAPHRSRWRSAVVRVLAADGS
jgi:hypothetical protein